MAGARRHKFNATMQVLSIVPMLELNHPSDALLLQKAAKEIGYNILRS